MALFDPRGYADQLCTPLRESHTIDAAALRSWLGSADLLPDYDDFPERRGTIAGEPLNRVLLALGLEVVDARGSVAVSIVDVNAGRAHKGYTDRAIVVERANDWRVIVAPLRLGSHEDRGPEFFEEVRS